MDDIQLDGEVVVPQVIIDFCEHRKKANYHDKEAEKLKPKVKEYLLESEFPGVVRNEPRTDVKYKHEELIKFLEGKFGPERARAFYKREILTAALDNAIACGELTMAEIPEGLCELKHVDVIKLG